MNVEVYKIFIAAVSYLEWSVEVLGQGDCPVKEFLVDVLHNVRNVIHCGWMEHGDRGDKEEEEHGEMQLRVYYDLFTFIDLLQKYRDGPDEFRSRFHCNGL